MKQRNDQLHNKGNNNNEIEGNIQEQNQTQTLPQVHDHNPLNAQYQTADAEYFSRLAID